MTTRLHFSSVPGRRIMKTTVTEKKKKTPLTMLLKESTNEAFVWIVRTVCCTSILILMAYSLCFLAALLQGHGRTLEQKKLLMHNDFHKWQNVLSLGKNSFDKPDMSQKPQSLGKPALVCCPTINIWRLQLLVTMSVTRKIQCFSFWTALSLP